MCNKNKRYKTELCNTLSINVTDEQRKHYEVASGYRLSQWVRDTLDAEIKRLNELE